MPVTRILPIQSPDVIQQVKKVLGNGGLVAFPTDTVYGLAAPIDQQASIDLLFEVKGRSFNKAIPVLIGDLDQLPLLTLGFSESAKKLSEVFWPGALTLIVKIRKGLPPNLSPSPSIGIRMPNHPFILSMLRQTGPLATTSANLSGGNNTLTAQEVIDQLGNKIDLLLDGGQTPGAVPSTVVDCTQKEISILRLGSISETDLHRALD